MKKKEHFAAQVIIFSFSKKECEALALQMAALDLNDEEEKKVVERVFTNAIDCLSTEDRRLPQIGAILPMLKRGVGVHHSGLLPILKEVIEILFQEGLIKVHSHNHTSPYCAQPTHRFLSVASVAGNGWWKEGELLVRWCEDEILRCACQYSLLPHHKIFTSPTYKSTCSVAKS